MENQSRVVQFAGEEADTFLELRALALPSSGPDAERTCTKFVRACIEFVKESIQDDLVDTSVAQCLDISTWGHQAPSPEAQHNPAIRMQLIFITQVGNFLESEGNAALFTKSADETTFTIVGGSLGIAAASVVAISLGSLDSLMENSRDMIRVLSEVARRMRAAPGESEERAASQQVCTWMSEQGMLVRDGASARVPLLSAQGSWLANSPDLFKDTVESVCIRSVNWTKVVQELAPTDRTVVDDFGPGTDGQQAMARAFQAAGLAASSVRSKQLLYWQNELADPPVLDLVLDMPRPPAMTGAASSVPLSIDAATTEKLRQLCASCDSTLAMGMIALYSACLCRHSGQEEVVVGWGGEQGAEGTPALGLRVDYSRSPSLQLLLGRVKASVLKAEANQCVPLQEVVRALGLQEDPARTLVFQAAFALQATAQEARPVRGGGCELDLRVCEDEEGGLRGELLYRADLFKRETAARFARHVEVLAREAVGVPSEHLDALNLLSAEEEMQIKHWNDTDVDLGAFERVEVLFSQQAARTPDGACLMQDAQALTFGEVDSTAERFAELLRSKHGVKPGDKVAMMMQRSRDMYVVLLGILKAKAAIVPIDVEHTPADRAQYMLQDCDVRLAVASNKYAVYFAGLEASAQGIFWEDAQEEVRSLAFEVVAAAEPSAQEDSPDAVFGIFYTSGTTGRPKGVRVLQRNVFNLAKAFGKFFSITAGDRILQFSSYSFIMSLRQIWPTITHGACLVVIERPLELEPTIITNQVTKLVITASALGILDPLRVPTLKAVQLGGERVSKSLAQLWGDRVDFKVGLGPTELTAHAMCNPSVRGDVEQVTIGHPHDNVRCYITNKHMQLQPIGVVGELCLAGANVTGGYLNAPELTSSKFIKDPFNSTSKFTSLYNTGDLAVRQEDGTILFRGRGDDQVKINGFRIELGEIQRVAEALDYTKDVAVLLREQKLVCYVTPASVDKVQMREDMGKRLPYYMVPAHFVPLDKFPLNKNSKLDRAALPAPVVEVPVVEDGHGECSGPMSEMETRVAAVYKSTLQLNPRQKVKKCDSFFDLGGTSLSAVAIMRALSVEFSVDLPVTLMFEKPKVREIAAELSLMIGDEEEGSGPKKMPDYFDTLGSLDRVSEQPYSPVVFSMLQYLYLSWLVVITLSPGLGAVLGFWYSLARSGWPLYYGMIACPLVLLGAATLSALLILATKWTLVGRLREGVYPLYGRTFLAWWFNRKLMYSARVWLWLLNETPLAPAWYRCLGATIGSHAEFDDVMMDEPDLVEIGDHFSGKLECVLSTSEVVARSLILRPLSVGDYVRLGLRAVVLPGTDLPDSLRVADAATVDHTLELVPGTVWSGALADCVACVAPSARRQAPSPAFLHSAWYGAAQVGALLLLLFLLQWPLVALTHLAMLLADKIHFRYASALIATVGGVVAAFGYFLLVVALKWVLVGRVKAETVYSSPSFFLRRWMVDRLLINPLFKAFQLTLLDPSCTVSWLFSALGVRIGTRPWMNPPMMRTGLDLVWMGSDTHLGQENVFFTDVTTERGVQFFPITIGDGVTFGQHTVCGAGSQVGKRSTIGACTYLHTESVIHRESTAFGNPANVFTVSADAATITKQTQEAADAELRRQARRRSLLRRVSSIATDAEAAAVTMEIVSSMRDVHQGASLASVHVDTPRPAKLTRTMSADSIEDTSTKVEISTLRYWAFASVAVLSQLVIPAVMFVLWSLLFEAFSDLVLKRGFGVEVMAEPLWLFAVIPACAVCGIVGVLLLMLALNASGLVDFSKGSIDYFGVGFMSWHICAEMILGWTNGVMKVFAGTGLYNWWLRRMGAVVGAGVFMDPVSGGFRELNHMYLDEGAVVLTHTIHAHYIDHGKLQFAPVRVGKNACVNAGCIVMPLTKYDHNCTLRPYTFTIKGQEMAADRVYQGNPAQQGYALPTDAASLSEVVVTAN